MHLTSTCVITHAVIFLSNQLLCYVRWVKPRLFLITKVCHKRTVAFQKGYSCICPGSQKSSILSAEYVKIPQSCRFSLRVDSLNFAFRRPIIIFFFGPYWVAF